jgi:hypothetical protein
VLSWLRIVYLELFSSGSNSGFLQTFGVIDGLDWTELNSIAVALLLREDIGLVLFSSIRRSNLRCL